MSTQDIEARAEAATPLTEEEYAEWKGNIEAIAGIEAGLWYRREGDGFVPIYHKPTGEMTTTVGIQLRLFATIGALKAELKTARETLAAVGKVRDYLRDADSHVATGEGCTLCTAGSELDRIMKGGA